MAASDFEAQVATGHALSRDGRGEAAIVHFQRLVERYPHEPRAHFALAGAFDHEGREAEAVAPYRRAMELGLAGDEVPRWYVQLGSTLRNVDRAAEAVDLLTEGRGRFPDDAPIRIFRALALHSADRCDEALVELLDLLLTNPSAPDLRGYERAIRYYTDELWTAEGGERA